MVEGRVWGDGDALVALKSRGGEDMDLDPRAVEGGISGRRSAMEDQHGEIA